MSANNYIIIVKKDKCFVWFDAVLVVVVIVVVVAVVVVVAITRGHLINIGDIMREIAI